MIAFSGRSSVHDPLFASDNITPPFPKMRIAEEGIEEVFIPSEFKNGTSIL
jgi:hypothetical protein